MTHYTHATQLLDAVGSEHGPSPWIAIEQSRVDAFAAATDDEQWIHVDPERAAAGPFGGTIAHGYLTLSLLPALTGALFTVDDIAMAVNYGLDKVRFLQPVRVGSRVRAVGRITSVEPVAMGLRVGMSVTVEIEGADKPALVAETIAVFVPAGGPEGAATG